MRQTKYKDIEKIGEFCCKNNVLYEDAHFECSEDGALIYQYYRNNGTIYQICIINYSEQFSREEKIGRLISLENTIYLSLRVLKKSDPISPISYVQVGDDIIFNLEETDEYKEIERWSIEN